MNKTSTMATVYKPLDLWHGLHLENSGVSMWIKGISLIALILLSVGCGEIKLNTSGRGLASSKNPSSTAQKSEVLAIQGDFVICQTLNAQWKCAGLDWNGMVWGTVISALIPSGLWWDGLAFSKTVFTDAPQLKGFEKIETSQFSSSLCGLKQGQVFCWGENNLGQIGIGSSPVQGLLLPALDIAVGAFSACAILSDRRLQCWGYINRDANNAQFTTAQLISEATDVKKVVIEGATTCFLKNDGTEWCWGFNGQYDLGNLVVDPAVVGAKTIAPAVQVSLAAAAVDIDHNCAILVGGAVECWGFNGAGITDPSNLSSTVTKSPHVLMGLEYGVTQISTANSSKCALKNGDVYCWGALGNYYDFGWDATKNTVTKVPGLPSNIEKIDARGASICFRLAGENNFSCYGQSVMGQFGNGHILKLSPYSFPALETAPMF